jgi:5-methylcytosine-specific restriction enzyme A
MSYLRELNFFIKSISWNVIWNVIMEIEIKKKVMYDARWRVYRKQFLIDHPLCERHLKLGFRVASYIVDHIKPHRGDEKVFWDTSNHQALCKQCHDSYKQRYEKSGKIAGCSALGIPTDPNHHWNKDRAA